jgi:hypothetical protein
VKARQNHVGTKPVAQIIISHQNLSLIHCCGSGKTDNPENGLAEEKSETESDKRCDKAPKQTATGHGNVRRGWLGCCKDNRKGDESQMEPRKG